MMQDLVARAVLQTARGDYGGAICDLDEAIARLETTVAAIFPAGEALHKALAACYSQRAACHREIGNLKAAISDMDRAIPILHPLRGSANATVWPLTQNYAEQSHMAGMGSVVEMLTARGTLLEQMEHYELSLADFSAALQIDATNAVALRAATRLRALLKDKRCAYGCRSSQNGGKWKSVPRPGMRAFENRGKAGAAF